MSIEKGYTIKTLDHGHVIYVDHLGSDEAICDAARVSYQKHGSKRLPEENQRLIRYLYKNKHTSPFEMGKIVFNIKMPIFVARQYIRHRMQNCITGDAVLEFDLPSGQKRGRRVHKVTMKQFSDRWNQNSSLRDRMKRMRIRCLDTNTGSIVSSTVEACWESDAQLVYELSLVDGRKIKATADHRVLTNQGWLTISEIMGRRCDGADMRVASAQPTHRRATRMEPEFSSEEIKSEEWRLVPLYEGYEVSSLGRVRSWRNTSGRRLEAAALKTTTSTRSGHKVVSLSRGGVSRAFNVHRLVLESFVGPAESGFECGHVDGNGFNNRLSNLRWISKEQNQAEKTAAGAVPSLSCVFAPIASIASRGLLPTYDIAVKDYHNFIANGIVVHNCNEVSARYTELPDEFYIPEKWRAQDTKNKQGSVPLENWDTPLSEWGGQTMHQVNSGFLRDFCADAYAKYQALLARGVAREMARMVLPLNIYTEMRVCWDLKNLLHFIALREDAHAQAEIQEYGAAVKNVASHLFPMTMDAYGRFKFRVEEIGGVA